MSRVCHSASLLICGLVLVTGCARVPREAGFGDVASAAAERTGGMRVHWNQGTSADAAVAAEVREMAAGELAGDHAVQIALLNNRRLQATYEDLMIAQADLVSAGLLSNPVFEAEVGFVEGGGGTGLELSVVQEFLGVLQIPLRKRIAAARFEAEKLRVTGAVLDLAAEVREAHVRMVAARQMVEMRQSSLAAAEASYELARRIREAGNITELTLDLERAQLEQARLDLAAAEYQVLARRQRLNALMGLRGEDARAWEVAQRLAELSTDEASPDVEDVLAGAMDNSLDLGALRREAEQSSRVLGLTRTQGLLPDLELGAKGEREADDGTWAVGPTVALAIPLLNQGQPQIAAAAAELRRVRAEHEATAVELEAAVRSAHALLENARGRVEHYRDTVLPLRQRIVEQTQLEYNAMITGAFQLLQARREQIEAGGQYIEALRDYWIARSALETLRNGRMRQVDAQDAPASAGAAGTGSAGAEH